MNAKETRTVIMQCEKHGYDSYSFLGPYKDFNAYELYDKDNENMCVGYPCIVLIGNNSVRDAEADETLEILANMEEK